VVRVDGKEITQARFTVHQKNPAPLKWEIPIVSQRLPAGERQAVLLGESPAPLASSKEEPAALHPVGYYRVAYQGTAWQALKGRMPELPEATRLAIAQDAWALVQAEDLSLTHWLEIAQTLQKDSSPTIGAHLVEVLEHLDHLARGSEARPAIRAWIRSFLAPRFAQVGWEPHKGEEPATPSHRAALITILGRCGEPAVLGEAQTRAANFLREEGSLAADLREPVLHLAGRAADSNTWDRLHSLGKSATSTEQKAWLYGALVAAQDPDLAKRALALSLAGELPAKLATRLVGRVAAEGEKPEEAWDFAKEKLPELLALMSADNADEFVARLFRNFSEEARADELEAFSKANLPPTTARPTAIAADDIRFKASLKARVLPELTHWLQTR
jgi:aminopeptidase N